MNTTPLTLHIGLAKTGTSTLQRNLFADHPGIHYFGKITKSRVKKQSLDEMTYRLLCPILWKVHDPMDTEATRSLLQDKILPGIPENRVLLGSWESLSGRYFENYVEMLDRSQAIFGGCRIMITLRNPLTRLPSLYLQNLRGNFIRNNSSWMGYQSYVSIEDWYRNKIARSPLLDYCEFIRIAIEKLGRDNVGAFLFEALQHNSSEYCRSICEFIGIDFDIAISLIQDKHVNARLSEAQLAHMRNMKSSWYRRRQHSFSTRYSRNKYLLRMPSRPPAKVDLTEQLVKEVSDRTRDDHRWLADTLKLPIEKYGYPL